MRRECDSCVVECGASPGPTRIERLKNLRGTSMRSCYTHLSALSFQARRRVQGCTASSAFRKPVRNHATQQRDEICRHLERLPDQNRATISATSWSESLGIRCDMTATESGLTPLVNMQPRSHLASALQRLATWSCVELVVQDRCGRTLARDNATGPSPRGEIHIALFSRKISQNIIAILER